MAKFEPTEEQKAEIRKWAYKVMAGEIKPQGHGVMLSSGIYTSQMSPDPNTPPGKVSIPRIKPVKVGDV